MEKIDYKHGRFCILTNEYDEENYPYEEYVQYCEENGRTPKSSTSDDYYQWVRDRVDDNYESDLANIKYCKEYQTKVCMSGVLGLWYGKVGTCTFVHNNVADAITACIGRDTEGIDAYYDNGKIIVSVYHHDGTNTFTISALSKKGTAKAGDGKTMDDPKPWDTKRLPYLYA